MRGPLGALCMKAFVILCASLFSIACSTTSYSPIQQQNACAGSGAVVAVVIRNGTPVENAVVQLWHETSDVILEEKTDSEGRASFTCITPEWYSLKVASPSKIQPRWTRVKRGQETRITLPI